MWVERIEAGAFGPLLDRELEFGPGLNIIYGPNESGKSSWHNALYAGHLWDSPGTRQEEVRPEFEKRHRPWNDERWEVTATVHLGDRGLVTLHQNLDSGVGSKATDALGQDVSNEIIFDGAPDGSVWLGLSRPAFRAVACVRQADVLGVLGDAEALQVQLQAASSGGGHGTAGEALDRIDDYARDNVGMRRANSTKPLQVAILRRQEAERRLEDARKSHAEFLSVAEDAEHQRGGAAEAGERARCAVAVAARVAAEQLGRRLVRLEALAKSFPNGPPLPTAASMEEVDAVADALRGYRSRPAAIRLAGETADDLQSQFDALPDMPIGDTTVDPDVAAAKGLWDRAIVALEAHLANEPPSPDEELLRLADVELCALAVDLEQTPPSLDPQLTKQVADAEQALAFLPTRPPPPAVVGAAVTAGVGLALILTLSQLIGGALLGLGVGAAGFLAWRQVSNTGRRLELMTAKASVEDELRPYLYRIAEAQERRSRAEERAHSLNIPTDPATIRRLASQVSDAHDLRRRGAEWRSRREGLAAEEVRVRESFIEALDAHEAPEIGGLPSDRFDAYRQACGERAQQAGLASQRPDLESRLNARRQLEQQAADILEQRESAVQVLRDAAERLGADESDEDLIGFIEEWQEEQGRRRENDAATLREYAKLESLLDGESLDDARSKLRAALDHAESAEEGLDPRSLEVFDSVPTAADLQRLAAEADHLGSAAAEAEGRVKQLSETLPGVAEAEEALAQATEELGRVERLEATLEAARAFLEAAQKTVYRRIAPTLAAGVKRWIGGITNDRYVDARVDPRSLAVAVSGEGGEWRQATSLSHGTAEQIYLLLRAAIAEYLATTSEVCPLLLDDVTVQSDSERSVAIMDALLAMSAERQIIAFSQEGEVLRWAEQHDGDGVWLQPLDPGLIRP
jgi:DNA repair protein SbcC/Rad50